MRPGGIVVARVGLVAMRAILLRMVCKLIGHALLLPRALAVHGVNERGEAIVETVAVKLCPRCKKVIV